MRIASKGILNQDQEVTFYFDSKPYQGFVGDTVASAHATLLSGITP